MYYNKGAKHHMHIYIYEYATVCAYVADTASNFATFNNNVINHWTSIECDILINGL